MSDKVEEEVWKVFSDCPWIEVSNLGRVRTKDRVVKGKDGKKYHIKGCVLKQWDNGHGYMQVNFRVNGKIVNLLVSRMVATCFISNPNGYPEVNHIDCDPTNNRLDNLEWCTHQYNIDYKNNFGTTSADIQGRPVIAVNLNTGKVLRFETQSEAARQLGINISSINAAVNGRQYTAGSYYFTEDENEITEEKIREIKEKMYFFGGVIAINLDGFEVLWFESQSEAARRLGVDVRDLNNVIKGRQKTAHDYYFVYADENAVDKVREKFGNKIARKVDELMRQNQN